MSTISAGVTSGSALVTTGDTSGNLVLQTNGATTGLTINTAQALGVGSSPSYGTSGQVLTSGGSAAAPSWAAIPATDLATGVTGTLPVANGGTGSTTLTANNVLLGNGTSAVQFVAPSTSGNVLTSNGTTWTSAAAPAGNLVLLSTTTASGSTFDITSGFSSTYDNYILILDNVVMASPSYTLWMRINQGGTVITSGYNLASYNGSAWVNYAGSTQFDMSGGGTFDNGSVVINISGVNTATRRRTVTWSGSGSGVAFIFGGGTTTSTAVLQGVRFGNGGTTFSSGTCYLYGIKKV